MLSKNICVVVRHTFKRLRFLEDLDFPFNPPEICIYLFYALMLWLPGLEKKNTWHPHKTKQRQDQ